jgi:hypothetical protein
LMKSWDIYSEISSRMNHRLHSQENIDEYTATFIFNDDIVPCSALNLHELHH